MPDTAPATLPAGTASGGVATTTGSYNPSTDFKGAPAGSYEAQLNAAAGGSTGSDTGTGAEGATGSKPPALIVTSTQSRSNYAANVNAVNAKTQSMQGNPADPSIVDFMSQNGMPSDYSSRAKLAAANGITGYAGTAEQNTQLLTALRGAGKTPDSSTAIAPATGDTSTTAAGTTGAGAATGTAGAGGGTTTATGAGTGGTTQANPDGSTTDPTTGAGAADPATKSAFDSAMSSVNDEVGQAQTNLDAVSKTLTNDPAAQTAVTMIAAKYNQQAQLIAARNHMMLGKASSFNGNGMQFAPEMRSNFMTYEQNQANEKMENVMTAETQATMKATQAIHNGDVKALDSATKLMQKASEDKVKQINALLKATNDHVKALQTQAKADQQRQTAQLSTDIRTSSGMAQTVADAIKKSGVTDPATIDSYIKGIAGNSGISNPDILKSAVLKAQQSQGKTDLSAKNTADAMANRDQRTRIAAQKKAAGTKAASTKGSGTDGAYKYTADDIASYSNLMNKGGSAPDGTKFGARGDDKYVDPNAYKAALSDWVKNGGSPQGFVKKFPVTNVNPASYGDLPQAIQPKPKAAAASVPQ